MAAWGVDDERLTAVFPAHLAMRPRDNDYSVFKESPPMFIRAATGHAVMTARLEGA